MNAATPAGEYNPGCRDAASQANDESSTANFQGGHVMRALGLLPAKAVAEHNAPRVSQALVAAERHCTRMLSPCSPKLLVKLHGSRNSNVRQRVPMKDKFRRTACTLSGGQSLAMATYSILRISLGEAPQTGAP